MRPGRFANCCERIEGASDELCFFGFGQSKDENCAEREEGGVQSERCTDAVVIGEESHSPGGERAATASDVVDKAEAGAANACRVEFRQHCAEHAEEACARETDGGAKREQSVFIAGSAVDRREDRGGNYVEHEGGAASDFIGQPSEQDIASEGAQLHGNDIAAAFDN